MLRSCHQNKLPSIIAYVDIIHDLHILNSGDDNCQIFVWKKSLFSKASAGGGENKFESGSHNTQGQ